MASKLIQTYLIKSTLSKHTVGLYPCFTQIRWRKPRWLPRAPTKEFYVREPTPIDPVEHAELLWRYKEYRHTVDAIRFIEIYIYIYIVISLKGVPLASINTMSFGYRVNILFCTNQGWMQNNNYLREQILNKFTTSTSLVSNWKLFRPHIKKNM
jgi:hypothetical protein